MRPNILYRVQVWTLTGPKHEPDGLVLKPRFWWSCVGWSIVLLKNNIWMFRFRKTTFQFVGSKPFCNIILYSKALIDFSQWSSSPVPAAEKTPHTMTPLSPCLTVVEMHSLLYFSPDLRTHLSGGQHTTEILIHRSTQLCWNTRNQTFYILPTTSRHKTCIR